MFNFNPGTVPLGLAEPIIAKKIAITTIPNKIEGQLVYHQYAEYHPRAPDVLIRTDKKIMTPTPNRL